MGRKRVEVDDSEINIKIDQIKNQLKNTTDLIEKRRLNGQLSYWRHHDTRLKKRRDDLTKIQKEQITQKIEQLKQKLTTLS